MSSIFRKDDNFVDKPNRNPFDLSYQNNLTTKFGVLKPVYCQEVIPGDTFNIKPTMAMRFLPQVFPVQTRMRAHMHFFYVRNRNLWKDWEDFIGKTKDGLVPPYLQVTPDNKSMFEVGGIADSFGVPVVSYSNVLQSFSYVYKDVISNNYNKFFNVSTRERDSSYYITIDGTRPLSPTDLNNPLVDSLNHVGYAPSVFPSNYRYMPFDSGRGITVYNNSQNQIGVGILKSGSSDQLVSLIFSTIEGEGVETNDSLVMVNVKVTGSSWNNFSIPSIVKNSVTSVERPLTKLMGILTTGDSRLEFSLNVKPSMNPNGIYVTDMALGDTFPYSNSQASSSDNGLKISALPFRAYEAVYNSFYRNAENNPLIIDGVPEYNKYNRTYDGGADPNLYQLFNRNWEDDFLTTALPSPQQGTAPLVGIVNRGDAPYVVTFSDENGNLNRVKFTYDYDNSIVQAVPDSEMSDEIAGKLSEYLMESTNVGISIQDFRNVNSFQRWLENNIRKGFKYRDQIKGHFGVSVRYDILDMPEFIGGVSRDVSVQQVTQTSAGFDGSTGDLGDYAGQAYAYGDGETISNYCDEHGYIIGILSVVPMSNYSQMMPKHLMKRDAFDYYFPEFGKIGMQPILNKEVTTLESIARGVENDVFGYQRAWYDYIARVDEVHGLFTTNLRNFLIGRTFMDVPQLSAQFSTIQNDQLNNIFYVDDGEDKILGQIYFDVTGVRPIPVYGIPSLE